MELTYPVYYKDFHCTADACRDNCCRTGWEIDVDAETVDYYRTLPQPQRQRIFAGLSQEPSGQYVICPKDGQCPFLTQTGLCSLVMELGEEHIGDICALHPRYREWFPGRMEIGVGLCCQEAAQLILSDPAPADFETVITDDDPDDGENGDFPLYLPLLSLRETLFEIAQDRTLSLQERVEELLDMAADVQRQIDGTARKLPVFSRSYLRNVLEVHTKMEALNPAWLEEVEAVLGHADSLDWSGFSASLGQRGYEYEHILVYLLFRYVLKAVFDGELFSRVRMAVDMTLAIAALGVWRWMNTGRFTLSDQIDVAKEYSKEVEYSDENMENLLSR